MCFVLTIHNNMENKMDIIENDEIYDRQKIKEILRQFLNLQSQQCMQDEKNILSSKIAKINYSILVDILKNSKISKEKKELIFSTRKQTLEFIGRSKYASKKSKNVIGRIKKTKIISVSRDPTKDSFVQHQTLQRNYYELQRTHKNLSDQHHELQQNHKNLSDQHDELLKKYQILLSSNATLLQLNQDMIENFSHKNFDCNIELNFDSNNIFDNFTSGLV